MYNILCFSLEVRKRNITTLVSFAKCNSYLFSYDSRYLGVNYLADPSSPCAAALPASPLDSPLFHPPWPAAVCQRAAGSKTGDRSFLKAVAERLLASLATQRYHIKSKNTSPQDVKMCWYGLSGSDWSAERSNVLLRRACLQRDESSTATLRFVVIVQSSPARVTFVVIFSLHNNK